MRQTKQAIPLNNTLEKLASQGYQIADKTIFFEQAETAVRSADWRLDMVQPVKSDDQNALVIAVSSASKHLKVVFVEYVRSVTDFWPTDLLKKLFPKRKQ